MMKKDYYVILGLRSDCKPHEIKKKYRNLALKWHPDKHFNKQEAASRFNEIHEAYTILMDSTQRQIYDKYGHDGLERYQDNLENEFFSKSFLGTNKSAFNVLWDIVFERDEDIEQKEEFEIPEYFKNFNSMIREELFKEDTPNQRDFLNDYIPTFNDPNFNFEFSMLAQDTDKIPPDQNRFSATNTAQKKDSFVNEKFCKMDHLCNSFKTFNTAEFPFIINDDESESSDFSENIEQQYSNSFFAHLTQFQSMIDDFHQTIKNNRKQFKSINPGSKRIFKHEKMPKSPYFEKKEQNNNSSVPIYS